MYMKKLLRKNRALGLLIGILAVLALTACQSGGARPGGATRPGGGDSSQDAPQPDSGGGAKQIIVTEAQLNTALDAIENSSNSNSRITINSAQVDFRPSAISLSMSLVSTQLTGDLVANFEPTIDANGTLQLKLIDLSIDNQNVPRAVMTMIEKSLNESIYKAMGQSPAEMKVQSIQVTDTEMIVEAIISGA
jgi:uncharacterized protein YpmS